MTFGVTTMGRWIATWAHDDAVMGSAITINVVGRRKRKNWGAREIEV